MFSFKAAFSPTNSHTPPSDKVFAGTDGISKLARKPTVKKFNGGMYMTTFKNICIIPIVIALVIAKSAFSQPGIFMYDHTVKLTSDSDITNAAFGCIHYIPSIDRFVVLLQDTVTQPVVIIDSTDTCTVRAVHYKEYYSNITPTGQIRAFTCSVTDVTSLTVGDFLYFGKFKEFQPPQAQVWIISKYDATNWQKLGEIEIPLNYPFEHVGGLTIGFVKNQIVLSGVYFGNGTGGGPTGSHLHFCTLNLDTLGTLILEDTTHIPMLSFAETDSFIYVLGSTELLNGKLLTMKYDKDWNYLGSRILKENAFFPTGTVWDGQRFYVAYVDISLQADSSIFPFPYHQNIRLAAFDKHWNLLKDEAVTNFTQYDYKQPVGPWVIKQGNQLYVSYVVDTVDFISGYEKLAAQSYVCIYNIIPEKGQIIHDGESIQLCELGQNYPNPFSISTEIQISIKENHKVELDLYNFYGEKVMSLMNERKQTGKYIIRLNAEELQNGIFFYRLKAGNNSYIKKMVVLK